MIGQLQQSAFKRWSKAYRTIACWGSLLIAIVLIQNTPLFGGRVWLLPIAPILAGRRRGREIGMAVGIAGGFLQDWTANGWFGVAGVLLGALGWGCGIRVKDE